jgi:hypothetical protein
MQAYNKGLSSALYSCPVLWHRRMAPMLVQNTHSSLKYVAWRSTGNGKKQRAGTHVCVQAAVDALHTPCKNAAHHVGPQSIAAERSYLDGCPCQMRTCTHHRHKCSPAKVHILPNHRPVAQGCQLQEASRDETYTGSSSEWRQQPLCQNDALPQPRLLPVHCRVVPHHPGRAAAGAAVTTAAAGGSLAAAGAYICTCEPLARYAVCWPRCQRADQQRQVGERQRCAQHQQKSEA